MQAKERERAEEIEKTLAALKQAAAAQDVAVVGAGADPHFDFVFGWSTGHVGTTTLSEQVRERLET